jgi:2-phospho-L-lactate/phosphoenolpyruvate guanylyltransferase
MLNILIPCKPLVLSKSRLAPILSVRQRHELCLALLDRTLAAARVLTRPDRVFLITADAEAASRTAGLGTSVIADRAADLNGALADGRDHIVNHRRPFDRLLVLPIDLPFADEVAIMRAASSQKAVVIAGDHDGQGTNLLMLRGDAALAFKFEFGPGSFARHCEGAVRAGYSLDIIDNPALAFDLDEPAHYLRAGRFALPHMLEPA